MKKKDLEMMRGEFVDSVIRMVKGEGFLAPFMGLFALNSDKKKTLMIVPLDGDYLHEEKDLFFEDIVPALRDRLHDQGFKIYAVCLASEAWARVTNAADFDYTEEAIKALPKEEILIITYLAEDEKVITLFDLVRDGKAVNQEGNIIDYVTLTERNEDEDSRIVISQQPEFDDLFNLLAK
jgi:hypothetical protein